MGMTGMMVTVVGTAFGTMSEIGLASAEEAEEVAMVAAATMELRAQDQPAESRQFQRQPERPSPGQDLPPFR
jgi:hypothetical protein